VATIDPRFRANVNRSIRVVGDFTDEMVSTLTGEILRLRADDNSAPITVFINSNGGAMRCLDYIYGLLSSKAATGKRPRIITVAVGNARSAAANLLALGDYAIAYPKAAIHFHGVRYGEVEDVTMETASSMAAQLESKNRATASLLARAGTIRLAFHYARLKNEFPKVRTDPNKETLSDIECFAILLKGRLSPNGDRIVDKALERWQSLAALSEIVAKASKLGKNGLEFEAAVLNAVIEFEVERNKTGVWSLDANGVFQIASDYLLLRDYDLGRHVHLIQTIFQRFSHAFFSEEEIKQMAAAKQKGQADESVQQITDKRVQFTIKPFCYFSSSIWQSLQEEENPLSPRDAYWLGCVDEVYDSKLPCIREVVENQTPQQPNLTSSSSQEQKPSAT
jgi:ATP-dependent protease ClpP protease subunit